MCNRFKGWPEWNFLFFIWGVWTILNANIWSDFAYHFSIPRNNTPGTEKRVLEFALPNLTFKNENRLSWMYSVRHFRFYKPHTFWDIMLIRFFLSFLPIWSRRLRMVIFHTLFRTASFSWLWERLIRIRIRILLDAMFVQLSRTDWTITKHFRMIYVKWSDLD